MTARRRALDGTVQALAPALLIGAVAVVGSFMGPGTQEDFISALVAVTIVVALQVFIGNSGVISFGHVSFVAVGAFAAGVLMRLSGLAAGIVTFAVLEITHNVLRSGRRSVPGRRRSRSCRRQRT